MFTQAMSEGTVVDSFLIKFATCIRFSLANVEGSFRPYKTS